LFLLHLDPNASPAVAPVPSPTLTAWSRGLIMALTFTCTLGVATASDIEIRTMLIGALGCNLTWGIIDGGVHLLGRLNKCAVQY